MLDSVGWRYHGGGPGRGLLSLFDYKEHGVVDAIVPTRNSTRTAPPVPDGPNALVRGLLGRVASTTSTINKFYELTMRTGEVCKTDIRNDAEA